MSVKTTVVRRQQDIVDRHGYDLAAPSQNSQGGIASDEIPLEADIPM